MHARAAIDLITHSSACHHLPCFPYRSPRGFSRWAYQIGKEIPLVFNALRERMLAHSHELRARPPLTTRLTRITSEIPPCYWGRPRTKRLLVDSSERYLYTRVCTSWLGISGKSSRPPNVFSLLFFSLYSLRKKRKTSWLSRPRLINFSETSTEKGHLKCPVFWERRTCNSKRAFSTHEQ